jgi:glyoxylase-like metal-dependent hydrolase (beta-lactamase superfamily II)
MNFTSRQVSKRVWCIVEDDPYMQFPFIYVVVGDDRLVVIDAGTGKNDLRRFIESGAALGETPIPAMIQVVATHVHFDHIGCCW